MIEKNKAVEEELDAIVAEILRWRNRKIDHHGKYGAVQRELGFQEGLRLSAAIVLARYFQEETEEE